jgi:hypothetical protein
MTRHRPRGSSFSQYTSSTAVLELVRVHRVRAVQTSCVRALSRMAKGVRFEGVMQRRSPRKDRRVQRIAHFGIKGVSSSNHS